MFQYPYPHPAVTTDIVLFTIQRHCLQLLLIRRRNDPYRNYWALPGGFVDIDEDLEACAQRELAEETAITDISLEQLYCFGRPGRDPRERVITIAYYALVPADGLQPHAADDAVEVAWFSRDNLPALAFDHEEIVAMAHQRLSSRVHCSPVALQFMPEKFTLGDLQNVYEIIKGEKVDKRNFRKRALAGYRITDTGETRRNGNHRPARLYRRTATDAVE